MAQARVKGYVVGYDMKGGEITWTVKVTDGASAHQGKKFPVHSMHQGSLISKSGVDVNFTVAPVQVGQEQVLMATDVALGHVFPRDEVEAVPQSINLVLTVMDGDDYHLALVGLKNLAEVRREYQNTDEQVVDLLTFTSEQDHFEVLHAMLYGDDDFRDAVEELLLKVFRLGQQHHTP